MILKFGEKELDLTKIGIDFDLSSQQVECLYHIHDFLLKDGYQTFCLKGYAGSGKTTIVKVVLALIRLLGISSTKVGITAPTHKAKNVIEKLSGKLGATIHSVCSLYPNVDVEKLDMDNIQFDPKCEPSIPLNGILICDEGSMINDTLDALLKDFCEQAKCKILFIGDPAQLKPVLQENISKIFLEGDSYELTQVHRQAGDNPLGDICFKIRTQQEFPKISNLNEKGEGIEFVKSGEFIDKLFEEFNSPNYSKDYCRALSFTNDNVKLLNQTIREIKDYNDVINKGDLLMLYDSIVVQKGQTLTNSMDFEVHSLREVTKNLAVKLDGFDIELINEKGIPYKTFLLHPETEPTKIIEIGDTLEELRFNAIHNRKLWFLYYGLKDAFCSFQNIRNSEDRVIKSKSIDYGYALTVHKSQGSTINTVFIENDFFICTDEQLRNQLEYVSFSRASRKVVAKI